MEKQLTPQAIEIITKRYLRKKKDSRETIDEWIARIVANVVQNAQDAQDAHELLVSQRFIPNTPCLMNAGTSLGQLAACFVLPVSDSIDEIFKTLHRAALIQQTGGGIGFDFSPLRGKDAHVSTSGGKASGPISFMQIYNEAFDKIAQGGMRRGANMAVLRVDHPDILAFINCKRGSESALTNFNISVAITDAFMQAVVDGSTFDLINPESKTVAKTIVACDLFREICDCAHSNGEPGILFIDRINRDNVLQHKYKIAATNPCGEIPLGPYENCCLGHINLVKHYKKGAQYSLDLELLRKTVTSSVTFLDCILDANKYVPAIPQLREAALYARRIGLGITGLADLLMLAGIPYGSHDCVKLATYLMYHIRIFATRASIDLAKRNGPFSGFRHARPQIIAMLKSALATCDEEMKKQGLQPVDMGDIFRDLDAYGIRNSYLLTVAPTGTTSMILGTEGYGCEPVYSHSYTRMLADGTKMTFCSRIVADILTEEPMRDSIIEYVKKNGELPAEVLQKYPALGTTALKVSPDAHLDVQIALQKFVDNSISKTINCAGNTTVAQIQGLYMRAWRGQLKGVTVYVDGSRQKSVLVAANVASTVSAISPVDSVPISKRERSSHMMRGCTVKRETGFCPVFVTVNCDDKKQPFEVFINVGKSGTEIQADSEAIGRLVSLVLRVSSPVSPRDRLQMVAHQLEDIGGSRGHRDTHTKQLIRSIPDAVASAISSILTEDELDSPRIAQHDHCDVCPQCGNACLRRKEGCRSCDTCGYSAC